MAKSYHAEGQGKTMNLILAFERSGIPSSTEWGGRNAAEAELKLRARRLRWLVHQPCPELRGGGHGFVADEGALSCLYCRKEV